MLKIITKASQLRGRVSVECSDEEMKSYNHITDQLKILMRSANGVGIAAPQVGIFKRMFLFQRDNGLIQVVINPEICWLSGNTRKEYEGCLSVPFRTKRVTRDTNITVKYFNGKEFITESLRDMESRIFQHEWHHLLGILFIDIE